MLKWHLVAPYFTSDENWGDPDKIKPELLFALLRIRTHVGYPFHVHEGYAKSGHSPSSQHYVGAAVDGHFSGISFKQAILRVEEAIEPFDSVLGLGLYPLWSNPGFHIDVRGHRARWGRINGIYVSYQHARDRAFQA